MTVIEQIILKLFEWPFLLFLGCTILILIFKSEISKIIKRGGITLTWGNKSFELNELPEQLNESFATVSDDIEDLKSRLKYLEELPHNDQVNVIPENLNNEEVEAAKQRMLNALSIGDYRWRSVERLASIANISVEQANNILRPLAEVVFRVGKSGRSIVRLQLK